MKIQRKRSNKIMASVSGKIPYELVSTLTVLRDYADVDDAYVSDEHKKLVDIADSIYNADIDPESMYDEYKSLYKKYGKSYFDKVLKDIRAIDSQISSSNVRDLADEYESRVAEFGGEVESACGKKSIKSSRRKTVSAAYEERRSFDAYGYNEDGDLEYEGLPYALDSIDEVTAWLKAMLDGVEEFKSQWAEWGGSTSELEMFGGPDDAENFGAEMYSNIIQNGLEPIAKKLGDMLDVYIYP